MEDTLRVLEVLSHKKMVLSLNPCFNGRYSQSYIRVSLSVDKPIVLILVLMEDTLRVVSELLKNGAKLS